MKKRILSIITTFAMLCSLIGVMPVMEVSAATFTPRLSAPAKNNSYYYSSNNIFYSAGYGMPNCTCYAYGRAYELLGSKPKLPTGDAGTWYATNKNSGAYSYGSTPKLGAIACFGGGSWGHVAVVESINGSSITLSESSYSPAIEFYTQTVTNMNTVVSGLTFQGYIYIGDWSTTPPVQQGSSMSKGAGQTLPNGTYRIYNEMHGNYFIDPVGSSSNPANETNIAMCKLADDVVAFAADYDSWDLEYVNDGKGFYKIKQHGTKMCMDVKNGSKEMGANVQLYQDNGTDSQLWSIKYVSSASSSGYIIQSKLSGYAVDISGGKVEHNTNVQVYQVNSTPSQSFTFIPCDSSDKPINDGNYIIKSANNNAFCLCGVGSDPKSFKSGTQMQIWQAAQIINIKHVGGGWYKLLYNGQPTLAVETVCDYNTVKKTYTTDGLPIQLYQNNEYRGQCWKIRKQGNHYVFISKANGYCLTIPNTSSANGNKVLSYHYGAANVQQLWDIVPYTPPVTTTKATTKITTTTTKATTKATTQATTKPATTTTKATTKATTTTTKTAATTVVTTTTATVIIPKPSFPGSGTKEAPYQISTPAHLFEMAKYINDPLTAPYFRDKYYIQTSDIDLNNEVFTPIGTRIEGVTTGGGFWGTYDGKFHKITNLNVNGNLKYSGLFGFCYNGGTIKNVSVYGNVKGTAPVGGIVGELSDKTPCYVENCSFNGNISSDAAAGGIVGYCWLSGYVTNCYFNGFVSSDDENAVIGGIAAAITVGNADNKGLAVLKKCYAVSNGKATGGIVGKFTIGNKEAEIDISNNVYLDTMSESGINGDYTAGCQPLSDEAIKTVSVIKLGAPFVENGDSKINNGYPVFEWQSIPYSFKGKGTDESPYLITSKKELEIFRDYINSEYFNETFTKSSYLLTTDIDLENEKWIPIGKRLIDKVDTLRVFQGHFDGGYHTIKGLNIEEASKFAGLFGCAAHGIIENISVEGTVNNTDSANGGIVGEIGDEIIRNCCFIGDINGSGVATGGILGNLWQSGKLENCYHIGKISTLTDHDAGGVLGRINIGETAKTVTEVKNCYHVGNVTGIAGSIIGMMLGNGKNEAYISIKNCYALEDDGAVSGNGTAKELDVTKLKPDSLKKAAELISSSFTNNPDSEFNNGYPVFKWQIKTNLTGDANNDNVVNVSDIVIIQKWITSGIEVRNSNNADLNSDGKVDVFDIIILKRKLLKK